MRRAKKVRAFTDLINWNYGGRLDGRSMPWWVGLRETLRLVSDCQVCAVLWAFSHSFRSSQVKRYQLEMVDFDIFFVVVIFLLPLFLSLIAPWWVLINSQVGLWSLSGMLCELVVTRWLAVFDRSGNYPFLGKTLSHLLVGTLNWKIRNIFFAFFEAFAPSFRKSRGEILLNLLPKNILKSTVNWFENIF